MRRALDAVMGPSHGEPGWLRYALPRAAEDPRTFVMIERWASKEVFDSHMASSHVQQLFAQLGGLVEGPPELLVLEPLDEQLGAKARI